MTALEEIKSPVEAEIERVVQSVNEWDDRTSPDDYPEHLLITSEELADILRNFAESTLESLQRENEMLRASRGGYAKQRDEILRLYDEERISCIREAKLATDMAADCNDAEARAEAAEAEVKRMRDRYECWMPVTETPPAGMRPDALLHFYCISDEVEGDESPEYWKTDTWQDKPADAVCWCAIVSPIGPHERTFIARTALASTGGEHHAE